MGSRVGRRGACLIFFGLIDLIYGLSLADPPSEVRGTPALRFVASAAPLWLWALLWLLVGVICLAGALVRRDRWAFAAAIGVKLLWGVTFLLGQIVVGLDRAYVTAAVWLGFAVFVYILSGWPEPMRPGRPPRNPQ